MRVGEQEIARLARWFETDAHLSERDTADALAVCEARLRPRQAEFSLRAKGVDEVKGDEDDRFH